MAWDREKEKKAGKAMTLGSCIFGLVFSIFWCCMALAIGAGFMLIFGIPFVGMMIYRLYVILQLSKEEPEQTPPKETDPWDRPQETASGSGYCPYCGSPIQAGFAYCPKCGRKQ